MSHLNNDTINEFFRGSFARGLVKKAGLKKEAYDQDGYYEANLQGPTVADEVAVAHPGGGHTTEVANSGGGGEGVYDVSQSAVSATAGPSDAKVETISEVAPYLEDVARKAPTGVQGSKVKGLAKKADPAAAFKKASRSLLQKLAQVAQELDEKGLREEADQIDAIIAEEVGSTEPAEAATAAEEGEVKTEETPEAVKSTE